MKNDSTKRSSAERENQMFKKLIADESGMTTVEYAVGTVAAASLGGILLKMLSSPEIQSLIWKIIEKAFSAIFGF